MSEALPPNMQQTDSKKPGPRDHRFVMGKQKRFENSSLSKSEMKKDHYVVRVHKRPMIY